MYFIKLNFFIGQLNIKEHITNLKFSILYYSILNPMCVRDVILWYIWVSICCLWINGFSVTHSWQIIVLEIFCVFLISKTNKSKEMVTNLIIVNEALQLIGISFIKPEYLLHVNWCTGMNIEGIPIWCKLTCAHRCVWLAFVQLRIHEWSDSSRHVSRHSITGIALIRNWILCAITEYVGRVFC